MIRLNNAQPSTTLHSTARLNLFSLLARTLLRKRVVALHSACGHCAKSQQINLFNNRRQTSAIQRTPARRTMTTSNPFGEFLWGGWASGVCIRMLRIPTS